MDTSRKPSRWILHRGVRIPTFLYGTAWKEDRTEALTKRAIEAGFVGIDTANQRRHYQEAGVGVAVEQALSQGKLKRGDLFLQTKFTYAAGQDHRLPYDPNADYASQVRQSFESSLKHLRTSYVDSYVLHGPEWNRGLSPGDLEVWRAMEGLAASGAVKLLGVSNIRLEQLQALVDMVEITPAFVQNRCYARTGWDAGVRAFCREHDILYQGFSLLTANMAELNHPKVHQIAERLGASVPQVVFRFALQAGMIPLTGTTSPSHMQEDLAVYDLELSEAEVEALARI